ncbi:hypothetical protein BGZ65_008382, partial [Modicella reniformis]
MRESLQREVEENIQKAKVLKEAMKESSDRDAEILMSEAEQEYRRIGGTPNNRSNTSLNKNLAFGQTGQQQFGLDANGLPFNGKSSGSSTHGASPQKRSTLDRIFGRKTSVNSHASSLRNHQVTPHPHPSSQYTASPSLQPSTLVPNGNRASAQVNASAVNLQELNYLPVEEEEEVEVRDRSMSVPGAGVGGPNGAPATGTEVKLHPTRSKMFALPKSLKNLKRRIAALRAKGTDLDAEKKQKEERERAANGGAG